MLINRKKITATAFIADQTPSPQSAHWMEFLNQDTPIFLGTEKIAKKLKYPVIYITVNRPKRGLYEIHSTLLFEQPEKTEDFEISEIHTKQLEKDIKAQPEIWLWSHRRWKHQRPQ
jgi:KDO2-lipid IV(A) lauroyltransferase